MRHPRMGRSVGWLVLTLLISVVPLLQAQEPVTLTIGVPDFVRGIAQDVIVTPFEAENPDIHIEIVSVNQTPSYDGGDMNEYLDSVADYVALSDLLLLTESTLVPEATRAGYFLDLAPFVRSDPEMNPDDFYPQFWNAFQWDGGMWAFPVAGDVIAMLYDPAKFDEAGLPYPDGFWTLDDFENAVRTMSEVDETTGEITGSAVQVLDGRAPVILSLFNRPLYDPNNPDALPTLTDSELEAIVQQWHDMSAEGLFTMTEGEFSIDQPMIVSQTLLANVPALGGAERELAPLPGGRTVLVANGIGVSAGTQYPDEAYRFIKYVSNSAEAATAFISALPARRSLTGAEVDTSNNPLAQLIPAASPEFAAQLESLLESAYTPAEVLYATHVGIALGAMNEEQLDAATALSDEEASIVDARAVAAERIGNVAVTITSPGADDPVVSEGEVALTFGVVGLFGGLPNQDQWDAAIDEFVENDPQVGAVNIEQANFLTQSGMADYVESYDCFYENGNSVPSADLSLLLPLDSYVASDPNFDPDDVIEGAINQLRREGQLWALPMNISPAAIWYNEDKFNEAGAFTPYEGWTIGDFETALTSLKDVMDEETPPFVPRDPSDGTYMLALIAAYGGLPIDFSQQPPKIDFANPAVIEATRQALNLVHDGYIKYQPLGNFGATSVFFGSEDTVYALYSQTIGGFLNLGGLDDGESVATYQLVSFPQGTDYVPVAYNVGSAYISGQTPNADACYRFIQSLMSRPALFGGMPVLASLLDSEEVVNSLGESAVEFYRGVAETMNDPKAVSLGGISATNAGGETLAVIWLYKAWDKYVEDDSVDLEKELQDADLFAKSYLECLVQAEADGTLEEGLGLIESFREWRRCAVLVDPAMESALPNF